MKPYEAKFLTLLLVAQLFVIATPILSNSLVSLMSSPEESIKLLKAFRTASTLLGQIPSMIICGLWLRRRELERQGNPVIWFFAGAIFTIQGLILYLGFSVLSEMSTKRRENGA